MSKVAISGNASGTGVFTIASPNSNVDRTLTLPDATGTILTTATPGVPVNGPAFSATNGGQSLSAGAWTKATTNSEEFDTASCYNNTGSTVGGIPAYAFLPTVAGYYSVTGMYQANGSTSGISLALYKNGGSFKAGTYIPTTLSTPAVTMTALIYLNGSTDYLELYIYSGSTQTVAGSYFQASMIRSAT